MFMAKKILKENYVYIIIILLMMISFSCIMRSSLHDKIILFDYKVIEFIKTIHNDVFVNVFKFFTFCGYFYVPFALLILLFIIKKRWHFLLTSIGYAIAGIITYFSKLLAGRPRPSEALINMPKSLSFPSGHTLTSLVFYLLFVYIITSKMEKRKRIFLLIIASLFALLIGFSRIYLGVHYFSDVLGGIIIGIPCLLMCINIISKNFKEKL